MGLDGVELVMAAEETFGIAISDEEAGEVITVGDFYNLVLAKLREAKTDRCLTSAAFYRIRRGFVDGLAMDRREIRPSLRLETILPRRERRTKWPIVQKTARIEIADLQLPKSIVVLVIVVGIVMSIGIVLGVDRYTTVESGLVMTCIGIMGFVATQFALFRLSAPFAVAFPYQALTLGDLAKGALAKNYTQLAKVVGGYNEKDAWEALQRIIVDQIGVAKDKVTPEARIVKDLGVG